jgi:glycosyltransferase involved in cell wall biosynthesis
LVDRLLSIIVPVYNEEEFVGASIRRALQAPLPSRLRSEVVAVDDGSTDSTGEILQRLAAEFPDRVRVFRHAVNAGKGAAIRTGLQHAAGEFGIIQDADLEYNPEEYPKILNPLVSNKADVVYGSRFLISGERRVLYYWHSLANHLITNACNMAADLNLTDIETCYKAFRISLARSIPIRSNRFGIEPELTIKFARRQVSIYEVPISYHGRTYEEGKKITGKDALSALLVILRCYFSRDIYTDPGAVILDSLAGTKRFNKWMAEIIRPLLGTRVLELGSGIGNMTQHLSRACSSYLATDLDDEHLARLRVRFQGRPNLQTAKCDLRDCRTFWPWREPFSYRTKNYALLRYDGSMVLHGGAFRSSKLERFARRFLRNGVTNLLVGNIAGVRQAYLNALDGLRQRELPTEDVSSLIRLTKTPSEYGAIRDRKKEMQYEALLVNGCTSWKPGDRVRVYYRQDGGRGVIKESEDGSVESGATDPRDYDVDHYVRRLQKKLAPCLACAFAPADYESIFADPDKMPLFAQAAAID